MILSPIVWFYSNFISWASFAAGVQKGKEINNYLSVRRRLVPIKKLNTHIHYYRYYTFDQTPVESFEI